MLCPAQGHPLPAFRYLRSILRAATVDSSFPRAGQWRGTQGTTHGQNNSPLDSGAKSRDHDVPGPGASTADLQVRLVGRTEKGLRRVPQLSSVVSFNVRVGGPRGWNRLGRLTALNPSFRTRRQRPREKREGIDRSRDWWREFSPFCILEPVGSSPPRSPPRSKLDALIKTQGRAATLLCEAQSSPPPLYR